MNDIKLMIYYHTQGTIILIFLKGMEFADFTQCSGISEKVQFSLQHS